MPTSGDFSLHVIGQAQGFEQMGASVNQFAGTLDTAGGAVTRFASTSTSLSSGFTTMSSGLTRTSDALGQFGAQTQSFSSGITNMQSSITNTGSAIGTFEQNVSKGGSGLIQFKGSMGGVATEFDQIAQKSTNAGRGLTQATTLTENLSESNQKLTGSLGNMQTSLDKSSGGFKTMFGNISQTVTSMGFAVGAVTGLVFSFTRLEAAHLKLERSQVLVESSANRVDDMHRKLAATIDKYGAGSQEAANVTADLAIAEDKLGLASQRAELIQKQFTETVVEFATQAVPTAVGVVGTLIQSFDALGGKAGILSKLSSLGSAGPGLGLGAVGGAGILGSITAVGGGLAIIANELLRVRANAEANNETMAKFQTILDKNQTMVESSQGVYEKVFGSISIAGNATAEEIKSVYDSLSASTRKTMEDDAKAALAHLGLADTMIKQRKDLINQQLKENAGVYGQPLNQFAEGKLQTDLADVIRQEKDSNDVRKEATKILNFVNPATHEYSQSLGELAMSYKTTGDYGAKLELQQRQTAMFQQFNTGVNIKSKEQFDNLAKSIQFNSEVLAGGSMEFSGMNNAMSEGQILIQGMSEKGATLGEKMLALKLQTMNWRSSTQLSNDSIKELAHSGTTAADDLRNGFRDAGISQASYRDRLVATVSSYGDVNDVQNLTIAQLEEEEKLHENNVFRIDQETVANEKLMDAHDKDVGKINELTLMTKTLEEGKLKIVDLYKEEAMATLQSNNLTGLRSDQIAKLAQVEEQHQLVMRQSNDTLLDLAQTAGIGADTWIQYKAGVDDTIPTIQNLNDQLEILINTNTNFLQMITAPTQEQLNKVNMAYTQGVVSLKGYVEQQVLAQHQQLGLHDAMVKTISDNGLFNGAVETIISNLKLTDPQMKLLIDDFIETGNTAQATAAIMEQTFGEALKILDPAITADKVKHVDNELKKIQGFKDFSKDFKKAMIDVTEDMNKTAKVSTEFGNDIDLMLDGISSGISSKNIKSGFKELTNDLSDLTKHSPAKGTLDPVVEYLTKLSGPEIMAKLPNLAPMLHDLNDALNAPKAEQMTKVQAVMAKYPEIFADMGIEAKSTAPQIDTFSASVSGIGKAVSPVITQLEALNKQMSKQEIKNVAKLKEILAGSQVEAPGTPGEGEAGSKSVKEEKGKKDGEDFGQQIKDIKALQAAQASLVKTTAQMAASMVTSIGKAGAFIEDAFTEVQKVSIKAVGAMASTNVKTTSQMGASMVTSVGKAGSFIEDAFTEVQKTSIKSVGAMASTNVKVTAQMGASMVSSVGQMGNFVVGAFKEVASGVASSMGKIVSSMKTGETAAKNLASAISAIKSKDVTVTTHYKTTGTKPSGSGGATGSVATGGIFWANQATNMTFGEAGEELALFLPLRQKGETRRGDFDITIPQPTPDVSGIKNMLGNALNPRNSKDLVGDRASLGQRAITIVLNSSEKVMMNERELIEIIRQKVFKHVINEMG